MADPLHPMRATDAVGLLPGPLGLRLDEVFLPFLSLSGTPDTLDSLLPFGQAHQSNDHLLLRFWPDVVLCSGAPPDGPWRLIDITHATAHLRLRGVEALHFLALYTTADLHAASIRQTRAIRTRLNHYDCALWWTNTRDIHILTDRSLAQSFCDHMRALAGRHGPADPNQFPRSVAPNAPDRRG